MKKDRFLVGILLGIVLLIVISLVLFFTRQPGKEYRAEDVPEGVLSNYVTALEKKDYNRAYAYLAEKQGKPDLSTFRQAFLSNQLNLDYVSLGIGTIVSSSPDEVFVDITILHSGRSPFSDMNRENNRAQLVRQEGKWKITFLPYPFLMWDWYQPTPSKSVQ
jgi:hypothetical protein